MPSKFYLDLTIYNFKKCFSSCETCIQSGDNKNNNCISCEEGFEKNTKTKNCEIKCDKYYYIYYYEKRCTKEYKCPNDYPLLVKEIGKCVANCEKEDIYKLQYNGECIKECPNNSSNIFGNICRDNNIEECTLTKRKLNFNSDNITDDIIAQFETIYTFEFNYTENHVTLYENDKYSIMFYKNENCISNLSLEFSQINLENCYTKVQTRYSLIDDKMVIGLVYINNFMNNKNNPLLNSLNMYDPYQGNKLNISDICQNESVTIQENILNKLLLSKDNNPNYISELLKHNVDVFNPEDKFYTDI